MAIVSSILLVTGAFIGFALISYLLVRMTFPKVENDNWEERYVQMKKEAERLTEQRKRAYLYKEDKALA